MLGASARLLRLLTLLQARATWAGGALAERLEVTPRTLRRDIDRLRSLGYPVESTKGLAGGYRLGEGAALPPLHLDEDEATAVFVGLHTARDSGVTGADTAAMRALSKLERVLPTRTKRRLASLRSSVLKLGRRAPSIALSDVALLASACSERSAVRFAYNDLKGRATERTVEPLSVVRVGELWYLVAWDPSKDAWRTFRLDRLASLSLLAQRFKARPPPGDDLVRYVMTSISSSPYQHRARVLLHSPAAPLEARVTAYQGVLEPVSNDRCILHTGARSLDGLAVFVVMLGVEFEILEPPELRPHMKRLAQRLLGVKARGKLREAGG